MESSTSDAAVLTEVRDRILLITLNRPDARNAINGAVVAGLLGAFERLDSDDTLSVGVLTGAGRGFCSGMDLKAFATEQAPVDGDRLLQQGCGKPLIAAIEGFAMAGGLELALLCDLLVAAEDAKLGIPEVQVGLFAAGGALVRLPRRLPYAVAAELALTADPITAEQAHAYGLVNRVVPAGDALDEALRLAERLSRNAPLAVAATKEVLRQTAGRTEDELFALQKPLIKTVFRSKDAKEGAKAFAEKRPPQWTSA
ncbi:crotonase/enoyl-CoA hydratase family protein [Mycolicibacter kumamotonensis]|uniref:Crotonase/enoyl-CoA hydratase family protein n=1 Tax=Mycolicibacter kumamotonensis TaxID=354243 RepID=A0A7K3LBG6_9MYCO|nr:crotonase/enoyl-CoA hydratase family protein [Mycolicibacter kumamotonensis]NDJ89711.1 crotonase/enoyl-CoA hydratase family protein [Mycolicibacter kumamotonensis]